APLVRLGVVEPTGVVVDAASGVSGAGRGVKASTAFCAVDEDFTAYGLLDHRHTPEIEQATGAQVLFTPHLAPMNRGILATCYARPTDGRDPLAVLHDAYRNEPFVVVSDRSPSTKSTLGSNCAHLTARRDPRRPSSPRTWHPPLRSRCRRRTCGRAADRRRQSCSTAATPTRRPATADARTPSARVSWWPSAWRAGPTRCSSARPA